MDMPTLRLRTLVWLAVLTPVGACGGGDGGPEPDCTPGTAPALVLGGGTVQTGFLALADGDEMIVVLGPQGLNMVTPAVRTAGLFPGVSGSVNGDADPLIEIRATLDSTQIGTTASEHLGLTETPEGDERLGVWLPFDPPLATYLGRIVTLDGEVTDACGRSATDTLDVVVRQ
jgi:hypothetical protein